MLAQERLAVRPGAVLKFPFRFQIIDIQCRHIHSFRARELNHDRPHYDGSNIYPSSQPHTHFSDFQHEEFFPAKVKEEGNREPDQCVILLAGCELETGVSVMAIVPFKPSVTIRVPIGWSDQEIAGFVLKLSMDIKNSEIKQNYEVLLRHNLNGWHGDDEDTRVRRVFRYVKIYVRSSRFVYAISQALSGSEAEVEERFVSPLLQLLEKSNIESGGVVEVLGGEQNTENVYSSVQVEFFASLENLRPTESTSIAPFLVASVDDECFGTNGFPNPLTPSNSVIGRCICLWRYGSPVDVIQKYYFGLGSHSDCKDGTIYTCQTEEELLLAARDFMTLIDPDIIIGYNIHRFDWKYSGTRMKLLGYENSRFFRQGRILSDFTPLHMKVFESSASKRQEDWLISMPGRMQLDVFKYVGKNYSCRSYKLTDVSKMFVNNDKIDLPAKEMFKKFLGGPEDRLEIAKYCMQDGVLPILLFDKLGCLPNILGMSRLTSTVPEEIYSKGQQEKVMNCLVRTAHEKGFVLGDMPPIGNAEKYQGATVLSALRGFYDCPVAVLDFQSLYPSIMIDQNMCYSTLVQGDCDLKDAVSFPQEDGRSDHFAQHVKGILPMLLQKLLAERRSIKAKMKVEKDPIRQMILDYDQRAVKVVCNSVYGFTGANPGRYPCHAIARNVTRRGRDMIAQTKKAIEEKYGDTEHPATVIYGDTDSVMIVFKGADIAKSFELGREAATYVTSLFGENVLLDMEKVYCPYFLINPKNYAGMKYEKPGEKPKFDVKGLDSVRRDKCLFVQKIFKEVLGALMDRKGPQVALEIVHSHLLKLQEGQVGNEMFEITCQLGGSYATGEHAAPKVAEKMRSRHPGSEPKVGERMSYIIVEAKEGTPVCDKAEDPVYAAENSLKPDYLYYLNNLMEKSISKLFTPFTNDTTPIFKMTKAFFKNKRERTIPLFGYAAFKQMPRMNWLTVMDKPKPQLSSSQRKNKLKLAQQKAMAKMLVRK